MAISQIIGTIDLSRGPRAATVSRIDVVICRSLCASQVREEDAAVISITRISHSQNAAARTFSLHHLSTEDRRQAARRDQNCRSSRSI
jgi:hypothetical protein